MKRFLIPAIAALALAGCSQKSQNESAEAGDAIAADANATTRNAVQDVDAASDAALGSAEATMDNSGARIEAGAERTGDRIEAGADRAGAAIDKGADRAVDATGNFLEKAGRELKQ
ncbi:hypothetical protein [uncultured Sphingomonas sp.]|uniref:hypothetical protein n=1 Tax=uncultured Sphingomonas sp. TaxID=158754 RepID=UPI0035CC90F8